MCRSNNEARVCKTSVEKLSSSGSRITYGHECDRAMWQHVIRYRLDESPTAVLRRGWNGHGGLRQRMYLDKPNGQPWAWSDLVVPKIQRAIYARVREARERGLMRYEHGIVVWADWARGFTSQEWDGETFTEEYGRELLAAMPECASSIIGTGVSGCNNPERLLTPQSQQASRLRTPAPAPAPLPTPPASTASQWVSTSRIPIDSLSAGVDLSFGQMLDMVQEEGNQSKIDRWSRYPQQSAPHDNTSPSVPASVIDLKTCSDGPVTAEDEEGLARYSIEDLTRMSKRGAILLLDTHIFLLRLRQGGLIGDGEQGAESASLEATVIADREVLLQELCDIDDELDRRMRTHYRLDGCPSPLTAYRVPLRWPLSGLIWGAPCWSTPPFSPLLEERREHQRRELGLHVSHD
ncbi:hypothetical protein QBC47DRAFT_408010 [Echria macrotheca]|uniref:Uncharacterized protein n=1 Tax=Echria macrotheca TaxID=438768 RepID=A0AAJ0B0H9_9PEZI|nr:hypothetical protein QBC47DRAFT_408010 [Echria macrotheca]